MSDAEAAPVPVVPAAAAATPAAPRATILAVFTTFLIIGATSFGGGVVAYLRSSLVGKKAWLTDAEFLELMSISNTLPGLNATNMAILVGDRLCGVMGATAALLGMCLPGFAFMTIAGFTYAHNGDRPLVTAALKGVAAAAVGLIAATWYQIGKKSVTGFFDAFFILAAVIGVNQLKLGVPLTLLIDGALAIFAYRPRTPGKEDHNAWIRALR